MIASLQEKAKQITASHTLTDVIKSEMAERNGAMCFSEFMEMCLYAPRLGYYMAHEKLFTQEADFTTAPEISPVLAHSLAMSIASTMDVLSQKQILEIGAGSGVMASDILQKLDKVENLPTQYFILEKSPRLRAKQKACLSNTPWLDRVIWCDEMPSDFTGVVVANEVLDALAIDLYLYRDGNYYRRWVACQDEAFFWKDIQCKMTDLPACYHGKSWPNHYIIEHHTGIEKWLPSILNPLKQGVAYFLDYGYGEQEYYTAERVAGTLCCYYKNTVHDSPLEHIGQQDITAHVDFTKVANIAVSSGARVANFMTQEAFLLQSGVLAQQEVVEDTAAQFKWNQQLKNILLPGKMGSVIKILELHKGDFEFEDKPKLQDLRYQL